MVRGLCESNVGSNMTAQNRKFLQKFRGLATEPIEEGAENDLKMVRRSQRYSVQGVFLMLLQTAVFLKPEHFSPHLWMAAFIFLMAVFGIWLWWRFENCRSELEDELLMALYDREGS